MQVRKYLEEHYQEKISLEELSGLFFISKYHLSREYKKKYGITIGSDLTGRRISHAKSLLRFRTALLKKLHCCAVLRTRGILLRCLKRRKI